MNVNIDLGMRGHWVLRAFNVLTGQWRELASFPNMITNSGKDLIATADYITRCQVGTDGTPPAAGQTSVIALADSTTSIQSTTYGSASSAPYYYRVTKVFEFAARTSAVNIAEITVGSTSAMLSRAQIKDLSGNPTSISLLVGDVLVATYVFDVYLLSGDTVLTGRTMGIWSGDITIRNAYAVNSNPNILGQAFNKAGPTDGAAYPSVASNGGCRVYNGAIGIETAWPSGTSADFNTDWAVLGSYVAGSYSRTLRLNAATGQGNLSGGISAIAITTKLGAFQFGFSPALPKTSSRVMTLDFTVSWSNAT